MNILDATAQTAPAPKSNRGRARSTRILPHATRRLPVLHLGAVAIMVPGGVAVLPAASADGGCIPGNISGQVPRLTRPSDNVCVPTNIAQTVQGENAAAQAGKGYAGGGAYGPLTCVSGTDGNAARSHLDSRPGGIMFRHSDSDVQGTHRRGAVPSSRGLGSVQVLITDRTEFMTAHGSTGRRAAAAAAGIALVMGCVPLAFADTGGNDKNFVKHLAVDCPQPYSQTCPPRDGISFDSSNDSSDWVNFFFQADKNPPACAPGLVTLYVDGNPVGPAQLLQPGGATKEHYMHLPLGPHTVEVQMAGALGGCNTGAMSGWSGTLALNTDQPSTTTPVKAPPEPPGGPQGPPPGGGFTPPR